MLLLLSFLCIGVRAAQYHMKIIMENDDVPMLCFWWLMVQKSCTTIERWISLFSISGGDRQMLKPSITLQYPPFANWDHPKIKWVPQIMQRISWPQHDMSKQKWPGVVSNDLFEHRHCFGLRSQGCFLPAKKNYGGRPSIWSTWGFGAFQSKRNCLRDRPGNPNKNMVLVESLGGGLEIWVAFFSWVFVGWRPQRFVFCCRWDLYWRYIDAGKKPGKPWDDMICPMKVDVIVICIIYCSDLVQKPISFAASVSMLCTCSLYILLELCCIFELHYPPWI